MKWTLFCTLSPILFLLILSLIPAPFQAPPKDCSPSLEIHFLSNLFHSGFVLPIAQVPPRWKNTLKLDDPDLRYVELGWGDWDYFMTPKPGVWTTLKAAFLPTASVMHVVPIKTEIKEFYREDITHIPLKVCPTQLQGFWQKVEASFKMQDEKPINAGPGLYRGSVFYKAKGRFHLLNNCNNWAEQVLQATGLPQPYWGGYSYSLIRLLLPLESPSLYR